MDENFIEKDNDTCNDEHRLRNSVKIRAISISEIVRQRIQHEGLKEDRKDGEMTPTLRNTSEQAKS